MRDVGTLSLKAQIELYYPSISPSKLRRFVETPRIPRISLSRFLIITLYTIKQPPRLHAMTNMEDSWEYNKETIRQLYLVDQLPLSTVALQLKESH